MRQGAFAEALTVSQGVFGEAGMECLRANTQTHAHAAFLTRCLFFLFMYQFIFPYSHRGKILTRFTLDVNLLCVSTVFELQTGAFSPAHSLR